MLHSFRYLTVAAAFVIIHAVPALAAPSVKAESAILINARTGGVIFEKNADVRRAPASLTKVMTCILGLEEKGVDATFSVSMAAAATEYSDLGMKGGDKMRAGELMRGMMLESDNGAAVAVAQNVSGSVLKFADRMNEKAKELGCRKTHFSNPHGLTARWHYTTARDMAKIAAYAMKNQDFRDIVGTKSSVIHWLSPSSKTCMAVNTNRLLGSYAGASGIKTGWTSAAKGCLAAAARRNDVELIAIILKSHDGDTRFADARKLLDYGFSVGGKGKIHVEQPVKTGAKRMPDIKKPGVSAPAVTDKPVSAPIPAGNKPVSVSAPAAKPPVTNQPASATVPAADKPVSVPAPAAQPPATDKPAVVSNQPVAKNTGIRMPVVRKPGA